MRPDVSSFPEVFEDALGLPRPDLGQGYGALVFAGARPQQQEAGVHATGAQQARGVGVFDQALFRQQSRDQQEGEHRVGRHGRRREPRQVHAGACDERGAIARRQSAADEQLKVFGILEEHPARAAERQPVEGGYGGRHRVIAKERVAQTRDAVDRWDAEQSGGHGPEYDRFDGEVECHRRALTSIGVDVLEQRAGVVGRAQAALGHRDLGPATAETDQSRGVLVLRGQAQHVPSLLRQGGDQTATEIVQVPGGIGRKDEGTRHGVKRIRQRPS